MSDRAADRNGIDDNYRLHLKDVLRRFGKHTEALDRLLQARGFSGDISSTREKTDFLNRKFSSHHIVSDIPLDRWFSAVRPDRTSAFELAFALNLNVMATNEFFRAVYSDRSFEYRSINEMMYYYCISRGLGYAKARELIEDAAGIQSMTDVPAEIMPSKAIRTQIDELRSDDELINFIKRNFFRLDLHNTTAKKMIRSFWYEICDIAEKEDPSLKDEQDTKKLLRAILGLPDSRSDERVKTIAKIVGPVIKVELPQVDTLDTILGGNADVSYEKVRNLLILLAFYKYQAQGRREGESFSGERCHAQIDQALSDAGFEMLYAGSPYDWIFLYADTQDDGIDIFREIIAALTK